MTVVLLATLCTLVAGNALAGAWTPLALPVNDLELLPESERRLQRLIVSLEPNRTRYFMLPSTAEFDPKNPDPNVRYLRRRIYWLNFEILHGQVLRYAPPYTKFFVTVPDPKFVPESTGNEEEVFRAYLTERLSWSAQQIEQRIRFLKVPAALVYPQDLAEVLGRDSKGRLVLGVGKDDDAWYHDPLRLLQRKFPDDFVLVDLGAVNTEGGDIELVWLPDGRIGLMVGLHRVRRFVQKKHGVDPKGRKIPEEWIEEARAAFRAAFFGVEVFILGEEGLRNPQLVSDELFHADMIANVMRANGRAVAFVPSYGERVVDANTRVVLAEEVRTRAQLIYDRSAKQLRRIGYDVVRLPFADHPVRNPVNVAKFVDPVSGRPSVLLGKYPYHLELTPGGPIPQFRVQEVLDLLVERVNTWRAKPDEKRWKAVKDGITAVWQTLDEAATAPNPIFEAQVAAYEKAGVSVVPIPIYPAGEGGLHCLLLQ